VNKPSGKSHNATSDYSTADTPPAKRALGALHALTLHFVGK
jgi:hypothetical protein